MKLRRITMSAVAGVAIAGGLVAVSASPAAATPQSCSHAKYSASAAVAICNSGTGNFRSVVSCQYSPYEGATRYVNGYGPWKAAGSGSPSYSYCPTVNGVYSYYKSDGIQIS
ncbi:hypothetical protein GA0070622_5966 [Micromonospora sediminicola]|uniref:Secreted protein n=1 Tax=Micromonospora sediminicola TaxID=946078 RepID=A0A1A9BIS1_9ACTN|nr:MULTISPECIES: hypothetical protein [Micromonospora]SBT68854.1 hypothetical protein GA0070622_5966 [Micromonospora sediminicola]